MTYECYCDYNYPEFFSSYTPVARKEHRCEECGCRIQPGEKYEYACGKWDGYFDVMKTCERCYDLRKWVQNNIPCFCWAYGNVHDDAREAINEARYRAPEETQGVLFGFLRRVVGIRKHNVQVRGSA